MAKRGTRGGRRLEQRETTLAEQQLIDEREEIVEDAIDECCEAYWAAGGGIGTSGCEDRALVRTILLTAANMWGISRDKIEQD